MELLESDVALWTIEFKKYLDTKNLETIKEWIELIAKTKEEQKMLLFGVLIAQGA